MAPAPPVSSSTELYPSPDDVTDLKGQSPTSRVRIRSGATRKPVSSPPRRNLDDRLAQEELIMPLLKGEDVLQLAARMGYDGSQIAQDNITIQWNGLLNLCEAEQRLSDMLKLLVYTFPTIKEDALIVRLRGEVGQRGEPRQK